MTLLALILLVAGPSEDAARALSLEEAGRRHLYDMALVEARAAFEELDRISPDSPAAPYYLATLLWTDELTRRGGMGGATFRTSSYWSKNRQAAVDETLARDFDGLVAEAIERSERLLERDPDDLDALFFRGAAEGISSAWLASIEHSYYGAYGTAKRGRADDERILELDPDYADAYLLPGLLEYTVATLPRGVKFLGFLFGVRGSKEKSVELIERAVEGQRARWAAMLTLAVVEQREKRYDRALTVLRELQNHFPGNPFLRLEQGSVHMLRKDYRAARSVFDRVAEARTSEAPWARAMNMELVEPAFVQLKLSESLLFDERYQDATRELRVAFEIPDVPAWLRAPMFLRRGMASDGLGRRRAAEADYRRAIALDADDAVNRLAKRYLKRKFEAP